MNLSQWVHPKFPHFPNNREVIVCAGAPQTSITAELSNMELGLNA